MSLTSGLGPTKARKLIEHFDRAKQFSTCHSELDSAGIRAVSAQSVATGKSAELGARRWRARPLRE